MPLGTFVPWSRTPCGLRRSRPSGPPPECPPPSSRPPQRATGPRSGLEEREEVAVNHAAPKLPEMKENSFLLDVAVLDTDATLIVKFSLFFLLLLSTQDDVIIATDTNSNDLNIIFIINI